MYCRKCGKNVPSGSAFCPYCGTKIEKEKESTSVAGAKTTATGKEAYNKFNNKVVKLSKALVILASIFLVLEPICIAFAYLMSVGSFSWMWILCQVVYFVMAAAFAAVVIPWMVFLILSSIKCFKMKPQLNPIKILVCVGISGVFVMVGTILALCAFGQSWSAAHISSGAIFPVNSFVMSVIACSFNLAGSIVMHVSSKKSAKAIN